MEKIRGLAIFKANGEPWTLDELGQICIFTGDLEGKFGGEFKPYAKYISDSGAKEGEYFMHFKSKEDLCFVSVDTLRRVEFNELNSINSGSVSKFKGTWGRITASDCLSMQKERGITVTPTTNLYESIMAEVVQLEEERLQGGFKVTEEIPEWAKIKPSWL